MKDKTLNVTWKKAVIQIAREMKKANQLTAIIGNSMLKNKLDAVESKKGKLRKIVENERLSYVR